MHLRIVKYSSAKIQVKLELDLNAAIDGASLLKIILVL